MTTDAVRNAVRHMLQLRNTLRHALQNAVEPARYNEIRAQLEPLNAQLANFGEVVKELEAVSPPPVRRTTRAYRRSIRHAHGDTFSARMGRRAGVQK